MESRLPTLLMLAAAVGYFADTFLPWTKGSTFGAAAVTVGPGLTGWSSIPAWIGAALGLVLVVWQLFRLLGVRLGSPAIEHVVAAFLGTTIAFLAGSGLAYFRFGAFGASTRVAFAYGAWLAVVLALLLVAASLFELSTYDAELARRLRLRSLRPVDPGPAE